MLDIVELDNGLKIYFINDSTKHTTYFNLIVNFGGKDNHVIINNKKQKIKSGVAHFLEHAVLECSSLGDLMDIFGKSGIYSNGITSIDRTRFYIDMVDNIYENIEVLLKGIHTPILTDDNINNIREPIIQEKLRSLDNKYSRLYNTSVSNILSNKHFDSVLGKKNDISSITSKDLKLAFKSFYRPQNEIIVVGGKFNKDKVLDIINKVYNSINFTNDIINYDIKENNIINKKKSVVKEDINIERSVITFKLNTNNLSAYNKLKLDTYLYFFLKSNFGITSDINHNLVSNNIIIGNIDYYTDAIENNNIFRIEANCKDLNIFTNSVLEYLNNKEFMFDENTFQLYKKNCIIDLIVRSDNIYRMIDPFMENVVTFNYEKLDSLSDFDDMTFNDYVNTINSLDFSNYNISNLIKS